MFIIRAFKLLFMKTAFILPVLVVLFLLVAPAAGTLNKIAFGSPVYIGETDVDISSALNGCHVIAWWQPGQDTNGGSAAKNISIVPQNTASPLIYHYTFSPDVFTGYAGTWYCEDKAPHNAVFTLYEPNISLQFWDLDNNVDVSGQSIPFNTNITYRINTNLDPALKYANRPNENPTDSFYTVSMTDPLGRPVSLLYTGTAGNTKTIINQFDTHPFVTASPYYGQNMKDWFHAARDKQGIQVYPPGTYTISVTANLNKMVDAYANSGISTSGKITSSNTVTLVPEAMVTTTPVNTPPAPNETTVITVPPTKTAPVTPPTTSPVAKKTTYSPLSAWIPLAAVFAGGIAVFLHRK
jgi:hypothetical protein